eukprot:5128687-Amphidinium_carterae.1
MQPKPAPATVCLLVPLPDKRTRTSCNPYKHDEQHCLCNVIVFAIVVYRPPHKRHHSAFNVMQKNTVKQGGSARHVKKHCKLRVVATDAKIVE